MKNLLAVALLTGFAAVSHATPQLVASLRVVFDARNTQIIDFKMVKVDGAQTQSVRNPNYPCNGDSGSMMNCENQFMSAPVKVPGYQLTIQFDSARNGDLVDLGDTEGQSTTGTRTVTFRASDLPGQQALLLPKDHKSRVAFANANFTLGSDVKTVQYNGAYHCGDTTGDNYPGEICYGTLSRTDYLVTVSTK